jgi:hypothetical protein
MKRVVSFHPRAREEVRSFLRWAAAIDPRLAAKAITLTRKQLLRALEFPDSGAPYWGDFRKLTIRQFKMLVLYRVVPNGVQVVTVADGRMDPAAIQTRLRSR